MRDGCEPMVESHARRLLRTLADAAGRRGAGMQAQAALGRFERLADEGYCPGAIRLFHHMGKFWWLRAQRNVGTTENPEWEAVMPPQVWSDWHMPPPLPH